MPVCTPCGRPTCGRCDRGWTSLRASQWLRRNIERNGPPITVFEAALTDFKGTVPFDLSGDAVGHIGEPEVVSAKTRAPCWDRVELHG